MRKTKKSKVRTDKRNYKDWFPIKTEVQKRGSEPTFREGELWWSAVGENVGIEINGKGEKFSRPVIILKKLSKMGFLAAPLTSQDHTKEAPDWYVKFKFNRRNEFAALAQIRIMSVYRLYRKFGEADKEDIKKIRKGFKKLYLSKNAPSSCEKGCCGKFPNIVPLYRRIFKKAR